jgi:xanthine/uracil permease
VSLLPMLYVLGGLALAALAALLIYFFVLYVRPPADPRHEKIAQWFTSIIVLICVMVVGSILIRVGITEQIAIVRERQRWFFSPSWCD